MIHKWGAYSPLASPTQILCRILFSNFVYLFLVFRMDTRLIFSFGVECNYFAELLRFLSWFLYWPSPSGHIEIGYVSLFQASSYSWGMRRWFFLQCSIYRPNIFTYTTYFEVQPYRYAWHQFNPTSSLINDPVLCLNKWITSVVEESIQLINKFGCSMTNLCLPRYCY